MSVLSAVNKFTFNATQDLFIAAVPISKSTSTKFYVNINVEGYPLLIDHTYNDSFWNKVIGVCVLFGIIFMAMVGSWLYY
jgi:hypothetical protein